MIEMMIDILMIGDHRIDDLMTEIDDLMTETGDLMTEIEGLMIGDHLIEDLMIEDLQTDGMMIADQTGDMMIVDRRTDGLMIVDLQIGGMMTGEVQIEGMMTEDIPIGVLMIEDSQIDDMMIVTVDMMIEDPRIEDMMIEMIVIVGLMTPEVLVDFLIAHQWIDVTIDTQTVLAVTGLVDVVVVGEVKGETEEVVETGGLEMVAVQKVRELILKGYFFLSFSRMSGFFMLASLPDFH